MIRSDAEQLVHETMEFTRSSGPELLEADSPALVLDESGAIYLVGLIGGKEVGKSAMVNALAGAKITEETSHGPGTQTVIAYAHRNRRKELEQLLESAAPGKYKIVTHEHDRLARQVLLDLPDIDSRFEEHIQLTRKMLRHM